MTILSILDELAADASRNAKLSILKKHKDNEELKSVFKYALDPYLTYYIKKIPEYKSVESQIDLGVAFKFLDYLANREVTGHAAIQELQEVLANLAPDDATVTERMLLQDLKCGVQESTVNKIWPKLIPTYPCLLGKPYDSKTITEINYPAIAQIKADGMRMNVFYINGKITIRARSGKYIEVHNVRDAELIELFSRVGYDCVLDGEMLVLDKNGNPLSRKIGNGILNKAIKGTISLAEAEKIFMNVWDIIPLSDFVNEKCTTPYVDRLAQLNTLVDFTPTSKVHYQVIETKIVNNFDEVLEYYNEALAKGLEGIMLKNLNTIWENKRSKYILKFKAEKECELRITGFIPGKVGTKREGKVGSLIGNSADDLVTANVSGFSDKVLDEITDNFADWNGRIMTVRYNERIKSQGKGRENIDSLFLPRFRGIRLDKFVADTSDLIE